jgi:ABC-type multidrug transport system permease subunit
MIKRAAHESHFSVCLFLSNFSVSSYLSYTIANFLQEQRQFINISRVVLVTIAFVLQLILCSLFVVNENITVFEFESLYSFTR